jgi:hypothetical protein
LRGQNASLPCCSVCGPIPDCACCNGCLQQGPATHC